MLHSERGHSPKPQSPSSVSCAVRCDHTHTCCSSIPGKKAQFQHLPAVSCQQLGCPADSNVTDLTGRLFFFGSCHFLVQVSLSPVSGCLVDLEALLAALPGRLAREQLAVLKLGCGRLKARTAGPRSPGGVQPTIRAGGLPAVRAVHLDLRLGTARGGARSAL